MSDCAARERTGLAREVGENGLRHVLRQMRVAADLPERGGIDEIDVPPDEFGEGVLGMGFERSGGAVRCPASWFSTYSTRRNRKTALENLKKSDLTRRPKCANCP